MKTSRLAVPANPCAGSRRRTLASSFHSGSHALRVLSGVLLAAALILPASAVKLAWSPNPEPDIASYHLSYGTSPGVHTTKVNAGLNTSATVDGLSEGTTYYFVVTATNQAGETSAPSAEISYQEPVVPRYPLVGIPRDGWSLHFVSSQESVGEDGSAINAFDGNPDTHWHSEWLSSNPAPPHEIQIDLGSARPIHGFR
jgi:hypothetical protein